MFISNLDYTTWYYTINSQKTSTTYVLNTWDQSSRSDTRSVRFCCRTELRFHIHRWAHSPARTGSHCSLFEHIARHQSIFTRHNQSSVHCTHRCHTWLLSFPRGRYTCRSPGHMVCHPHSHMTESSSDRTCPAHILREKTRVQTVLLSFLH